MKRKRTIAQEIAAQSRKDLQRLINEMQENLDLLREELNDKGWHEMLNTAGFKDQGDKLDQQIKQCNEIDPEIDPSY